MALTISYFLNCHAMLFLLWFSFSYSCIFCYLSHNRHSGWLAGYQMTFDTAKSKLTQNNFAVGFTKDDFVIHAAVYVQFPFLLLYKSIRSVTVDCKDPNVRKFAYLYCSHWAVTVDCKGANVCKFAYLSCGHLEYRLGESIRQFRVMACSPWHTSNSVTQVRLRKYACTMICFAKITGSSA